MLYNSVYTITQCEKPLPISAVFLYEQILLQCKNNGGETQIRDKDLALLIGCGVRTVSRYLGLLRSRDYLVMRKKGIHRVIIIGKRNYGRCPTEY